ncbi:MAG: hypothetical protein K2Y14_00125 [Burkholderiales bacterium]|nr:hypothetical protein [Burkholderiales bacterium]
MFNKSGSNIIGNNHMLPLSFNNVANKELEILRLFFKNLAKVNLNESILGKACYLAKLEADDDKRSGIFGTINKWVHNVISSDYELRFLRAFHQQLKTQPINQEQLEVAFAKAEAVIIKKNRTR